VFFFFFMPLLSRTSRMGIFRRGRNQVRHFIRWHHRLPNDTFKKYTTWILSIKVQLEPQYQFLSSLAHHTFSSLKSNPQFQAMASLLLRPIFRPQTLGLGLGLGLSIATLQHRQAIRLDGPSTPTFSSSSYSKNARTPVLDRRSPGGLNPRAVRQVSSGSIIGTSIFLVIWRKRRGMDEGRWLWKVRQGEYD